MHEFEKREWDHLHDVILGVTWNTTKTSLNQEQLEKFFEDLPEDIKMDAYRWGLNDSVVRDMIYVWYQNELKNKLPTSTTSA